ncbi:hypothetical protein JTB14_019579 [Gonioctena quinquepunctata]|nr:hypothetical protein JTB14_019579 [Gonioctena quinquepunctata]
MMYVNHQPITNKNGEIEALPPDRDPQIRISAEASNETIFFLCDNPISRTETDILLKEKKGNKAPMNDPKPKVVLRRVLNTSSLGNFKQHLAEVNWDVYAQTKEIEPLSDFMITTLNTYVTKCFPFKQRKQDTPTPVKFSNDESRHKRDTLSALKTISASSRNPQHIEIFKSNRKHYNSPLKCAKRKAYDEYIQKSTNISRDSWRLINYERNSSQSIDTYCDLTADEFSDYYSKVAGNIINEHPFTNIEASDFLNSKPRPKD